MALALNSELVMERRTGKEALGRTKTAVKLLGELADLPCNHLGLIEMANGRAAASWQASYQHALGDFFPLFQGGSERAWSTGSDSSHKRRNCVP